MRQSNNDLPKLYHSLSAVVLCLRSVESHLVENPQTATNLLRMAIERLATTVDELRIEKDKK